jgi:putative ABC transport system ATP-binding protein
MAEVRLEGVRKGRPAPGGTVDILKGVTLTASSGELTVIIGPSGGGKSTLVRLINRLEDPDGGLVLLDGTPVTSIDPLEVRRRIALVPQKPFIFDGTVLFNLQRSFHFRGIAPPEGDAPEIAQTLELCRLDVELMARDARTLSLGQQQRLSLARALLSAPEVLLLDEPTSALDRPTGDRLADTLREICRSRSLTVLMVTHDLRLAERVADRLAYLEQGRILEEGSAADLLNRPRSAELGRFLNTSEPQV